MVNKIDLVPPFFKIKAPFPLFPMTQHRTRSRSTLAQQVLLEGSLVSGGTMYRRGPWPICVVCRDLIYTT